MKHLLNVAILVSVVGVVGACGAGGAESPEASALRADGGEEWVVLFDGETMNGWEARPTSNPDTSGDWTIEDGALVCGGGVPSWIHTDAEYSNYRLVLDFQGPDSVNSGIFLRSQKEGQPHRTGYELQVWDYQPAGYNTGSLVEYVFAPPAPPIRPNAWNTYDITAHGDHFLAILNGDTILDAHDPTHSSGVIGLQCQPRNPIMFRNIRISTLD